MVIDNVVLNKTAAIEKCIKRIHEEYLGFEDEFETNYTKQDSIILNLERACQATIDIASHLVKTSKLGIPQESRELFELLEANDVITEVLCKSLQSMVGFRNLSVHDYQELNLDIVRNIIENKLVDLTEFSKIALKQLVK